LDGKEKRDQIGINFATKRIIRRSRQYKHRSLRADKGKSEVGREEEKKTKGRPKLLFVVERPKKGYRMGKRRRSIGGERNRGTD